MSQSPSGQSSPQENSPQPEEQTRSVLAPPPQRRLAWPIDFLPGLLILWLFVVFGVFYLVQKPFGPANARAIGNVFLDLLAAGWLGILGLGLGHRLLIGRWEIGGLGGWEVGRSESRTPSRSSISHSPTLPLSHSPNFTTGEALILGCGLGLGALGLATLGLGLVGLLYRWLFMGLSLGLTLLLWPDLFALGRQLRCWRPAWPNRLTLLYLGALGFFTLVTALLPPIDWDGLFYHLTAPKIFIQMHRISPGMDVPHFNFPFLAEMLFTYGLLLRGDIAVKLIHTLSGLLLTGIIYLIARRHLSQASAWPAVLILLSMPMIVTLAGWAYNDLTLAFYQLAALYALLNYQSTLDNSQSPPAQSANLSDIKSKIQNPKSPAPEWVKIQNPYWLVLSGLFAGLAMSLKYTSFIGPLTLGLLLLWWTAKRELGMKPEQLSNDQLPLRSFAGSLIRSVALFAGPALLVALPWYLKNYFFTGNPFYPFLSSMFDGVYWDEFRAAAYAQAGTGIGFEVQTLLQLPLLATLGLRDVNYFDGRTGPLFLAFLPLILIYGLFRYRARQPERPAALDSLLIFALAQFLFWTLGVIWSRPLWQSRLLLPCLAALAPVMGWLWQDLAHLTRRHFSVYRFVNLLIGLVLVLNLVELGLQFAGTNPLAYLAGYETRAGYLTRRLGAYYGAMEQLNQTLPPEAVVLFLWEPRSYFCQVECRPDSILDQLVHDHYLYGEAGKIVAAWQAAGITHMLLNRHGLNFIKNEGTDAATEAALEQLALIEQQYVEPVFDVVGAYQLYKLRQPGPTADQLLQDNELAGDE